MEHGQTKLQPCTNCGFNTYELIDGHYYCTECNEQCMFVVAVEHDEFANVGTQKSQLKVKAKKSLTKNQDNNFRRTSYEEYNYILHGLTNEILELEEIPNFKVTVLQLWISYLKSIEAGFMEDDSLALPKMFVHHRRADAEILYNKAPKIRKKYPKKKKAKVESVSSDGEATVASFRKRKRKIRRGLTLLDTSETIVSSSTSMSSLASMSIADISSVKEAQELNIEFSTFAKEFKKKIIKQKEKLCRDMKFDEDGELIVNSVDLERNHATPFFLNEKTLIYILYSALNICGSRIQLGDLLRLTRDGHISFYNFLKHIPENNREQLSLTKGQSFGFNKVSTLRDHFRNFVTIIPELKSSFKLPNMSQLVERYLKELHLPDELHAYIERLINIIPPVMAFNKETPNYEGRAVAYIIFVLKVMFGIDGYREIEISKSAKKLNKKLSNKGIESEIFVYEEWREFIAYRDIILSKYYFPYIRSAKYQGNKPYQSFLAMLDRVKPEILKNTKKNQKVFDQKRNEKVLNAKNLASKLSTLHEVINVEEDPLNFDFTLTPLHDAMNAIMNNLIGEKLNKKITGINHRTRSCFFFVKPKELKNLFDGLFDYNLTIQKCKFPKTYFFKKEKLEPYGMNRCELITDKRKEDQWKEDVMKSDKIENVEKRKFIMEHNTKRLERVLDDRMHARRYVAIRREKLKDTHNTSEKNFVDKFFSDCEDEEGKPKSLRVDEIFDKDLLDEKTAAMKKKDCSKFANSKDSVNYTFITPDFNLWHRHIFVTDTRTNSVEKDFLELPKNFRWLLTAAANVISQEKYEVYRQLLIIEKEMINQKHSQASIFQFSKIPTNW